MQRRDCLAWAAASLAATWGQHGAAQTMDGPQPRQEQARLPFDRMQARAGYLQRLRSIQQRGLIPLIDVESSYNPHKLDVAAFVSDMDTVGMIMCASAEQPSNLVNKGQLWSDHSLELQRAYPTHFIPVGNGGGHPAWSEHGSAFLDAAEQFLVADGYPMMGEFEFHHYPSPRQVQRGDMHRDVQIAIDGPLGHRLFALAEKTGLPFQLHYEIEDVLLPPLESMLQQYPKATVIWCHFDQIRYSARSTLYGPSMLAQWLQRYPQLYVDTAMGHAGSVYELSGERHSRYWTRKSEWHEVMAAHPYRFLAALDIGGDRTDSLLLWGRRRREFIQSLPDALRERVAYKAAWKLIYHEEI
ncbi:amidohydrolase family protein [Curvibacter sp. CHRR-16]|uniref:amidohydrolase family protein n=1 Tax=Curvibacter sp. CHRR-16 TaxID=2835872 RepID=UPI001BD9B14E|nr:amidohydrolase family protein [Curvibacter sp. CHRR-16]MBT0569057.1 amidohydrolase family protein [Curvibacter sp. CHRR-16]